jgi:hypothetical protein
MDHAPLQGLRCWVITDGKAGMESQCLGLARALGVEPTVKRVTLRPFWKAVTPYVRVALQHAAGPPGDPIEPPWPDLVIATGRQSVASALAVKRATRGRAFLVQIQNPRIAPRHFDLVVTPEHDRLAGANVLTTVGALHGVDRARLDAAAAELAPRLADLPRPRVAVLIGGTNDVFRMTPTIMGDLAEQLAALAAGGAGLMVTPSRRTGADNLKILQARLAGLPAEIWDGSGANPYFGYLGLADHVVVTEDSVNMVSEAAATGVPVHVVALDGGSPKFDRFHQAMRRAGVTRPFEGRLDSWTYDPPDDTGRAAAEVRRRLAAHRARAA